VTVKIPADMNRPEIAAEMGAKAVVSIRDMLVLLGAPDQDLRDFDERDEILAREPWRNKTRFVPMGNPMPNGMRVGFMEGEIDWTGTRFEEGGK
jgi:hypothetical protein